MDKSFPPDWNTPITARGVTKNVAGRCYNVRISVAGKQLHIACAAGQGAASRLYDMALWKLCPKMSKRPEPNDAEWFSMLTQNLIDTKAPKLNTLYAGLPFVNSTDYAFEEQDLRERALCAPDRPVTPPDGQMHDYDKTIEFLRRAVVEIADLGAKFRNRTAKLTRLHKLARSEHIRSGLTEKLAFVQIDFNALRDSLEAQRAYYQKLVDTQP